MELRQYQKECINAIPESGSHLIQMATGLGKTVTFANIPRRGRTLILSHRDELVHQPQKYFDCSFGVEQAGESSRGEEVVSASVQSLVRRLGKFSPTDFDTIITDEAHHAAAQSYRTIYDHFKPRLHLGFTATPNRGDEVRLDDVFEDIIFERDLKWGIENGYLSDIYCLRANIGYDLSHVATKMGDYAQGELAKAMNQDFITGGIAEAYAKYAKGQTLIFASSVEHAEEIAKRIAGAVVVSAQTKNRAEIIAKFTRREIPCLVNCMIFTEGTDIPLVETIMIARPTKNSSLYTQMVGRGVRLCEGKDKLTLIDCVGVTAKADLCTAPTLVGVDMGAVPENLLPHIEGDLFDLERRVEQASDCPASWIKNVKFVDLWAREQKYKTHNINLFKMPNGDLVCQLPSKTYAIRAQNELGKTVFMGEQMPMQAALDRLYRILNECHTEQKPIWDLTVAKRGWGNQAASDKQMQMVRRRVRGLETTTLTKLEASQILNRIFYKGARA